MREPAFVLEPEVTQREWSSDALLGPEGLRRLDEREDPLYFGSARGRPFFCDGTSEALRAQHDRILPAGCGSILDLGASLRSHLPARDDAEVTGLGLSAGEMAENPALARTVVHDLNRDPRLPFPDGAFDAVVCSGSIDLFVRPLEIAREVARVLRPGGVFIVSFTARAVFPKAIEAWREEDVEGRIMLATAYCSFSGAFPRPFVEVTDLETGFGAEAAADEALAVVWTYRPPVRDVVTPRMIPTPRIPVPSERHCPYCGTLMSAWQPPTTPWEIDYGVEVLHVCFDDDCPYFRRGRTWCRRSGMRCATYRHSRNPATGAEGPLPVPSHGGLRSGIVGEA